MKKYIGIVALVTVIVVILVLDYRRRQKDKQG
jgi:heme/copper-type cytochrome/quinol oxidase subunit 2